MSVGDEWSYPHILRQPIRDRKRYSGDIAVSGQVRSLDDPEIVAQINERWVALTKHFGIDPASPDVWKHLTAALSGFDYAGFTAAEADWARLASKLIHQRFPGFRIDPSPDTRKWTLKRYRALFRIVEIERHRSLTGTRAKPKSVAQAARDLLGPNRRKWLKVRFGNAEALRSEYYHAERRSRRSVGSPPKKLR